jgi:hypothetical protein
MAVQPSQPRVRIHQTIIVEKVFTQKEPQARKLYWSKGFTPKKGIKDHQ